MGLKRRLLPLLMAAVALQAGCSLGGPSKPARFYALSAEAGEPIGAPAQLPLVGVGPITMPEVYERPQIVTRPETHRLELAEFDRWGGSLVEDVKRILAQNLMSRLGSDAVLVSPWPRQNAPDVQVVVQFFRFDGTPGKQVDLSGLWQLLDTSGGCSLEVHRFDISRVPSAPGYDGYVGALSDGLAQLSQDIAGRVARADRGCPP